MTSPTVAGPRRAIPSGVYTGEELQTRSARPGAYDALTLPSRFGDRQVAPGAASVSLASAHKPEPVALQHRAAPPPPPAMPRPAPKAAPASRRAPGSVITSRERNAADDAPAGPAVDVLAHARVVWRPELDPAVLQRFIDSTAALSAALAELERQALVVAQAMGDTVRAWTKAQASIQQNTGHSDAA